MFPVFCCEKLFLLLIFGERVANGKYLGFCLGKYLRYTPESSIIITNVVFRPFMQTFDKVSVW